MGSIGDDFTATMMNMVEAKPVARAVIAGSIGGVLLDLNFAEALGYGSQIAVFSSAADVILTGMGVDAKIEDYIAIGVKQKVPFENIAAGLAAGAAVGYFAGLEGRPLAMSAALSGAIAAVAPTISGQLIKILGGKKKQLEDLEATSGNVSRN